MIELRIHRIDPRWERVPGQEVRYGGSPPAMRLVYTDVLEFRLSPNDEWTAVPIRSDEAPPDPRGLRRGYK